MFPDYTGRRIGNTDPEYPAALNKLGDAPPAIWIAGALATAAAPAVAIVGTRHASPYGLRVARTLAATCARAGVCVVSGLARGIDGAAHEGALEAGGRTVAVLGTSLDVAFPKQHRALQQQVARDGLLVSEMEPGLGANTWTFPRRNRLIAAFSQLVVVVEAGTKSGAQITVEHAHTLNIPVAAVPGMMDAPQAWGTNRLIRDGAHVITEPDDVLALLNVDASPAIGPHLSGEDAQLWDALTNGAADVATLAKRAGLTTRNAAASVSALEIAGLVRIDHTGFIHIASVGVRL